MSLDEIKKMSDTMLDSKIAELINGGKGGEWRSYHENLNAAWP